MNRKIQCQRKILTDKNRKIHFRIGLFMCCGMLLFSGGSVRAADRMETAPVGGQGVRTEALFAYGSADNAEGQVPQEDAASQQAAKTGKIITKQGIRYYEYPNGKMAKNKWITVGKKTYYFGSTGAMEKGWMKQGKKYYYLDRNTGVQKKSGTVDGIKIAKGGTAKKTAYNKSKIDTMIKAKEIVKKQTKVTDRKAQKLETMFKWVMKHPYKRHRILAQVRKTKGWEVVYANDIFKKNGNGCCVSEACAFAFLAHECGYAKVYVCDDTEHAWVEINGRVYDTLFAESKSYSKYYNSTYKVAKLYRMNKLKI